MKSVQIYVSISVNVPDDTDEETLCLDLDLDAIGIDSISDGPVSDAVVLGYCTESVEVCGGETVED